MFSWSNPKDNSDVELRTAAEFIFSTETWSLETSNTFRRLRFVSSSTLEPTDAAPPPSLIAHSAAAGNDDMMQSIVVSMTTTSTTQHHHYRHRRHSYCDCRPSSSSFVFFSLDGCLSVASYQLPDILLPVDTFAQISSSFMSFCLRTETRTNTTIDHDIFSSFSQFTNEESLTSIKEKQRLVPVGIDETSFSFVQPIMFILDFCSIDLFACRSTNSQQKSQLIFEYHQQQHSTEHKIEREEPKRDDDEFGICSKRN